MKRVPWVEAHEEVRPPERMWEGEAPAEPESPPALRSAAVAPASPWRYREYIDFSELWFFIRFHRRRCSTPGSEAEIIRPDRDALRVRRDRVRSFIGVGVTVTRIEAFLGTLVSVAGRQNDPGDPQIYGSRRRGS